MLTFEFSESQQALRQWAKKISEELIAPHAERHTREKISTELLKVLASQGFTSLTVSNAHGGQGLDAVSFSLVIRELSKICGSVGVTLAVTNMVASTLEMECRDPVFLKKLISGEYVTGSFCLTESSSGSDAKALKSKAVKVSGGYEVSGEKLYVTNGAFSGFFIVMAKIENQDRPSAFVIPRESKGVVIGKEEEKMGLIGSSTIRMAFDRVYVPENHLLGAEGDGFKIAMRALDSGRISVASQALGIAEASLAAGVKYAQEREAFGKKLSEFQALQWKIADASVAVSAAELLILRAAAMKDRGESYTREASMAKLFTTESACRVCEDMIQILGGYGYIKEFPIERYYRDVRVTTLYEGTSEIQRLVIARSI